MKIGGFQKNSFIDYPEKIASVVFTQGCNWRCSWCHNLDLVYPERFQDVIPEERVFEFLKKRKSQIEGIVITGGEPTLQADLPEFIRQCRMIGIQVKLDTNGSRPKVLKLLLEQKLLNYIAMDIKGPFFRYHEFVDVKAPVEEIKESIELICSANIPYEFRTTIHPDLHNLMDVELMCLESLSKSKRFVIQRLQKDHKSMDLEWDQRIDLIIEAFRSYKDTLLKETEIVI